MHYDKLIRDHIPEIILASGKTPITHIADDIEYWQKLKLKLREEVEEVLEEKNIPEELADVLEVIHAICAVQGIDLAHLESIRQTKKDARGGFAKRLILEQTN